MSEDREHRIRERAHALWEQEGRPDGRQEQHWNQASQEIGGGPDRPDGSAGGTEEPALDGQGPAVGESLGEIARGEHQGP